MEGGQLEDRDRSGCAAAGGVEVGEERVREGAAAAVGGKMEAVDAGGAVTCGSWCGYGEVIGQLCGGDLEEVICFCCEQEL